MTVVRLKDGKPVTRDGQVGIDEACCCGGCPDAPWCVQIAWDLMFDDVHDGMPGLPVKGSATVWVAGDHTAVPYAVRTCNNGNPANDEPFSDPACGGGVVGDFCDGMVYYGGVETSCVLDFTWEFNDPFFGGVALRYGDTLHNGVNNINEDLNGLGVMLTGTVTMAVAVNAKRDTCGCP